MISENPKPFPYVLVTKEGITVEDDKEYKVSMIADGYTAAVAEIGNPEVTIGTVIWIYWKISEPFPLI